MVFDYTYDKDGNILTEKKNNVLGNVYIYGNGLENLLIGYNVYRYTANAHGDVVKVYSGSTVVAEYDYEAYGENVKCVENGISNPLRYSGYYYDTDTEKYYLKNRYYDGTRGRFLTEDPYWNVSNMLYGNIADDVARNVYYPAVVQSGNRVAYCMGNPVICADSNGESVTLVAAGVIVAFGLLGLTSCNSVSVESFAREARFNGNYVTTIPEFPGWDATISPGIGWEWRGSGEAGSAYGAWYNPATGESLHPDFYHEGDILPHWDYIDSDKNAYRIYEDGTYEQK